MDFIGSKINFIKNNHISCFIFNDTGKVLRLKDALKLNKFLVLQANHCYAFLINNISAVLQDVSFSIHK
jgi:hypothetical protein